MKKGGKAYTISEIGHWKEKKAKVEEMKMGAKTEAMKPMEPEKDQMKEKRARLIKKMTLGILGIKC